jgi:carbamoyl-phosphate synthase large subunit
MRDASIAVLRKIGVETGGSNVQFAVNPEDGRLLVIEMNPRVSRSSALASKATGFPIAKVAAKLASATRSTSCATRSPAARRRPHSSRPSTTWSRRSRASPSRSFPAPTTALTTQMKSVGEVMAMGRTFKESLQKALRGLETGIVSGSTTSSSSRTYDEAAMQRHERELRQPRQPERSCTSRTRSAHGCSLRLKWHELSPYRSVVPRADRRAGGRKRSKRARHAGLGGLDADRLGALKRKGFSDARWRSWPASRKVRCPRTPAQARPAAGLQASGHLRGRVRDGTAYMYSTYEEECEAEPTDRRRRS